MWWLIALQTAQPLSNGKAFDLATTAKPVTLAASPSCDAAASDELVVCGKRRDRYRLPLPVERITDRARGEAQTGMAAMTPSSRCGIFAGERQCSKREAAEYGYGKGRDPVTILTGLAGKLADPDAE